MTDRNLLGAGRYEQKESGVTRGRCLRQPKPHTNIVIEDRGVGTQKSLKADSRGRRNIKRESRSDCRGRFIVGEKSLEGKNGGARVVNSGLAKQGRKGIMIRR